MIHIQREHKTEEKDSTMKIAVGQEFEILHCLTTDESFIKIYDVELAKIDDGNGGTFNPNLSPISQSDFLTPNVQIKGVRKCGEDVVHDASGNPIEDTYNYMVSTAKYEQTFHGKIGESSEFLQVSQTDQNGNLVGISNFRKVGR